MDACFEHIHALLIKIGSDMIGGSVQISSCCRDAKNIVHKENLPGTWSVVSDVTIDILMVNLDYYWWRVNTDKKIVLLH